MVPKCKCKHKYQYSKVALARRTYHCATRTQSSAVLKSSPAVSVATGTLVPFARCKMTERLNDLAKGDAASNPGC